MYRFDRRMTIYNLFILVQEAKVSDDRLSSLGQHEYRALIQSLFLFQVTAYLKRFPFQLPQGGVGIMDGVDEGKF